MSAAVTRDVLTALSTLMTPCLGISPLALGSGKLGTPCTRMQDGYARSPVAWVLMLLEPLVVVEPVATPGADGPPPQAAMTTPTAKAPPAISAARRRRRRHLNPSPLVCRWV